MKIIIRVDATVSLGNGHVMRCLTLADRLRDLGSNVGFICKESPENLIDFIRETGGFAVDPLPDNPAL